MKNNKKAELTTENIVTLIVLIIGFIILLAFITGFNPSEEVDRLVCKTSVLLKATSKQIPILGSISSSSLNCHTRYICITSDNKCNKDSSIKIIKKVSSSEEIFKILAEELSGCWSMFGEGKLDYFSKFNLINKQTSCSFCSLIYFDSDLNKIKDENSYFVKNEKGEIIGLNQTKFYFYLSKNRVGNTNKNYLEYLYGISSFSEFSSTLKKGAIGDSNKIQTNVLVNLPIINISKNYFVLLGAIDSPELLDILSKYGGSISGAALGLIGTAILFPTGAPVIVWAAMYTGGALIGGLIQSEVNTVQDLIFSRQSKKNDETTNLIFLGPNLIEAEGKSLKNIKCSNINTLA
jgi:hypothetical protein